MGRRKLPLPIEYGGNMKEIKIVIDGKDYVKKGFTGEDWLRLLDYIEAAGDKILTKQFFDARYDFLSDVMKIDRKKLEKADLEEVTAAFKEIESGISSAFFGTPVATENEAPATQE